MIITDEMSENKRDLPILVKAYPADIQGTVQKPQWNGLEDVRAFTNQGLYRNISKDIISTCEMKCQWRLNWNCEEEARRTKQEWGFIARRHCTIMRVIGKGPWR